MDDFGGFERLMDGFMSLFSRGTKLKTVHKRSNTSSRTYGGASKEKFNQFSKQKQIDLILDKISKSGYDSLSKEEKRFLFEAGKD